MPFCGEDSFIKGLVLFNTFHCFWYFHWLVFIAGLPYLLAAFYCSQAILLAIFIAGLPFSLTSVRVHSIGHQEVVTWPVAQNGKKPKNVVLPCSFWNLFESYYKVLPLWRYVSHHRLFVLFCVFLHENNTKQHDFNTFRILIERATIILSLEIWPKKEGTDPKMEIDMDRLQKIVIDYKLY